MLRKSIVVNDSVELYLIFQNEKEPFSDCHYFTMDAIDRSYGAYDHGYIPMDALQQLAQLADSGEGTPIR